MKLIAKICTLPVATAFLAQAAMAGQLSIEANKTVPVKLRGAASSVVLGNQNVADVAVHDDHLLFVTGKSFGTTNLLVFDKAGNQIYSAEVVVTVNSSNLVTINRSGQNYTYDCAPQCRSVLSPGDDGEYFDGNLSQQRGMQKLNDGE